MPTLFTTLIEKDLAFFVYQDDVCVAFLDINPAAPGHCLVVPRVEVDQWIDLDTKTSRHLFKVAQRVGSAQKQVFGADRIGLMIAGFEVPHCHLHLIPANSMADFELGSSIAPTAQLEEHKKLIIGALAAMS